MNIAQVDCTAEKPVRLSREVLQQNGAALVLPTVAAEEEESDVVHILVTAILPAVERVCEVAPGRAHLAGDDAGRIANQRLQAAERSQRILPPRPNQPLDHSSG